MGIERTNTVADHPDIGVNQHNADRPPPPAEPPDGGTSRAESRARAAAANDYPDNHARRGDTAQPRETIREHDRPPAQHGDRSETSTGLRQDLAREPSNDNGGDTDRPDQSSNEHTDDGRRAELDSNQTPRSEEHPDRPSPTDNGAEQPSGHTEQSSRDAVVDQEDVADASAAEPWTEQRSTPTDTSDEAPEQTQHIDHDSAPYEAWAVQAAARAESRANAAAANGELDAVSKSADDSSGQATEQSDVENAVGGLRPDIDQPDADRGAGAISLKELDEASANTKAADESGTDRVSPDEPSSDKGGGATDRTLIDEDKSRSIEIKPDVRKHIDPDVPNKLYEGVDVEPLPSGDRIVAEGNEINDRRSRAERLREKIAQNREDALDGVKSTTDKVKAIFDGPPPSGTLVGTPKHHPIIEAPRHATSAGDVAAGLVAGAFLIAEIYRIAHDERKTREEDRGGDNR